MGLDSVEFVMALEEAFGIYIPDVDAVGLATPRTVIDYLEKRSSCRDLTLSGPASVLLRSSRRDASPGEAPSVVYAHHAVGRNPAYA